MRYHETKHYEISDGAEQVVYGSHLCVIWSRRGSLCLSFCLWKIPRAATGRAHDSYFNVHNPKLYVIYAKVDLQNLQEWRVVQGLFVCLWHCLNATSEGYKARDFSLFTKAFSATWVNVTNECDSIKNNAFHLGHTHWVIIISIRYQYSQVIRWLRTHKIHHWNSQTHSLSLDSILPKGFWDMKAK